MRAGIIALATLVVAVLIGVATALFRPSSNDVPLEPITVEVPAPTVRDGVRIDFASEVDAAAMQSALLDGEPSIFVRRYGTAISLSVAFMNDGEAEVIAARLREILRL